MFVPVRFKSPNIAFRMQGRPFCQGGRGRYRTRRTEKLLSPKQKKSSCALAAINRAQYANIVRLSANSAMAEAGWEISDEPVYIIITIYLNYAVKKPKDVINKIYEDDIVPTRAPKTPAILNNFTKWLKGVVYKNTSQIGCCLVLKKYTPGDEYVDVLIGRPRNYEDLIYDLRNN